MSPTISDALLPPFSQSINNIIRVLNNHKHQWPCIKVCQNLIRSELSDSRFVLDGPKPGHIPSKKTISRRCEDRNAEQ
uniref:Uncharacterized protein n=1 Tax=Mesocestoides corti TaxID=53468 RepID=A0A5K3F9P4_MESCO